MPYKKIEDLSENIRNNLPEGARVIFKETYNNAWEQYKDPEKRRDNADREEAAIKVAWSAVKKKYRKNKNGDWVKKQ